MQTEQQSHWNQCRAFSMHSCTSPLACCKCVVAHVQAGEECGPAVYKRMCQQVKRNGQTAAHLLAQVLPDAEAPAVMQHVKDQLQLMQRVVPEALTALDLASFSPLAYAVRVSSSVSGRVHIEWSSSGYKIMELAAFLIQSSFAAPTLCNEMA